MRIGVFDSGIGGEAVAMHLATAFPDADIVTVNDVEHVPYGNRSEDEIRILTKNAIQPLLSKKCDVIVIACNTATAVAITTLRETYPNELFVGLEPMLKPAAASTKSGVIAVCATHATLESTYYKSAKEIHTKKLKVFEPDCSDWAELIQENAMNRERIEAVAEQCLKQNADVIVLGCTHYHWIKEEIIEAVGSNATVLDPSEAIARRIQELLESTAR